MNLLPEHASCHFDSPLGCRNLSTPQLFLGELTFLRDALLVIGVSCPNQILTICSYAKFPYLELVEELVRGFLPEAS